LFFAEGFSGEPIFSNIGREYLLFLGLLGANGFFFLVDVIEIGFKGRFRRFSAFSGDAEGIFGSFNSELLSKSEELIKIYDIDCSLGRSV
jgi:hypothetical protein